MDSAACWGLGHSWNCLPPVCMAGLVPQGILGTVLNIKTNTCSVYVHESCVLYALVYWAFF